MRRLNPSTTQWALIGVASALTLGLAGTAYAASRRIKKTTPEGPLGPQPGPEEPPVEPPPPEQPGEWNIVTPEDPGYPWEFPALSADNYPTPGTWFNANDKTGSFNPEWGHDAMVRALLKTALTMAGNDPKIANAVGKDVNASLGRALRKQLREAIMVVGGVNDLVYGQTNLNYAGGNDPNKPGGNESKPYSAGYVLNEEDRGLNWLPRHADNLQLIQLSQPLKRTTSVEGQKLPSPNAGSRQMLIWLPALDLEALGPDKVVPSIKFLKWSDGSSTISPPPVIQGLGVDLSGVRLPGV